MLEEINTFVGNPTSISTHITRATFDSDTRCLTLHTKFSPNEDETLAMIRLTETFMLKEDKSNIAVIVDGSYHTSSTRSFKELVQWAVELCKESNQMFAMATALSDQWEHGMTFEMTPNSIGTSLESSTPMHPQLRALIVAVRENKELASNFYAINDDVVNHRTSIAIMYPLTLLEPLTCEAWNLVKSEPLEVMFMFHRERFLEQSPEVWVGQRHHIVSLNYVGAAGQLKNIFEMLLKTMAEKALNDGEGTLWSRVAEENLSSIGVRQDNTQPTKPIATKDLPQKNTTNASSTNAKKDNNSTANTTKSATKDNAITKSTTANTTATKDNTTSKPAIPPSADFVTTIMAYLNARIETLTEYCVVCDDKHQVSAHLTKSSVCTRANCVFRFQTLNVGKNAASSIGIHLLVLEAMVMFTKTAILSDRFENILTPFPEFMDHNGEVVSHPTSNRDITKLRAIVNEIQSIRKAISGAATISPRATALINWIVTSNTSFIKKLDNPIKFMESAHQYMFIQSTQKNAKAFEELKKTKKTVWAYHGSRPENWHSIIRNGLVNASGTKLQVNGAAYGSGIYMSPNASVSYGYSTMCDSGKAVPAKDSDEIPTNFLCIAICEVIEESIQKNSSIWVQPHETHVMTRFFFVFNPQNVSGSQAVLTDKEFSSQLDKALKENLPQ